MAKPVCAWCEPKQGQPEDCSHTICEDCLERFYPAPKEIQPTPPSWFRRLCLVLAGALLVAGCSEVIPPLPWEGRFEGPAMFGEGLNTLVITDDRPYENRTVRNVFIRAAFEDECLPPRVDFGGYYSLESNGYGAISPDGLRMELFVKDSGDLHGYVDMGSREGDCPRYVALELERVL